MKWKDSKGREWRFECNVLTMSRVKKETGIDLTKAISEENNVIEQVIDDVSLFYDVTRTLLRDQLVDAGVTDEEFALSLNDEDVVTDACRALVEGILDFFPPERREPLKKAFRRLWDLSKEKMDLQAKTVIDQINSPEFDQMMKTAVETGDFSMEAMSSGGVSD